LLLRRVQHRDVLLTPGVCCVLVLDDMRSTTDVHLQHVLAGAPPILATP